MCKTTGYGSYCMMIVEREEEIGQVSKFTALVKVLDKAKVSFKISRKEYKFKEHLFSPSIVGYRIQQTLDLDVCFRFSSIQGSQSFIY